jgi:hypothetical protein
MRRVLGGGHLGQMCSLVVGCASRRRNSSRGSTCMFIVFYGKCSSEERHFVSRRFCMKPTTK